jgi:hypothetical protein
MAALSSASVVISLRMGAMMLVNSTVDGLSSDFLCD